MDWCTEYNKNKLIKKEVLKGGRAKKGTVGVRELPEQCGQQLRRVRIYWDIYKFCGYNQIRINQSIKIIKEEKL